MTTFAKIGIGTACASAIIAGGIVIYEKISSLIMARKIEKGFEKAWEKMNKE